MTKSHSDIEDIFERCKETPPVYSAHPVSAKHLEMAKHVFHHYWTVDDVTFEKIMVDVSRIYKIIPTKRMLIEAYRELNRRQPHTYPLLHTNPRMEKLLTKKSVRSDSGIVNVSVSLPPSNYSCKYNCHFCPNEAGMPRSYLSNEDVFKRALRVEFDTVQQAHSRFDTLERNGHPVDKIEYRILGGTFSCYDHSVTHDFMRDLFYAANTWGDCGRQQSLRDKKSLYEEQCLNETANVHVVGIGVETRPDEITLDELRRFRTYGVTRVEVGIQHTDDALLRNVNRGHGIRHSIQAVRLLKNNGFKVEIHVMTDLPNATPEMDMACYERILGRGMDMFDYERDYDLMPDYMKDYPCLDVDFTVLREWRKAGRWKPYSETTPDASDLKRVLIYRQKITPPWVRVNRIQRDFRVAKVGCEYGYHSSSIRTNLAQIVKNDAEAIGIYCQCIRCCEVRGGGSGEDCEFENIEFETLSFRASMATEYFVRVIRRDSPRPVLYGFLRLRILDSAVHQTDCMFDMDGGRVAMIRELHVYGKVMNVGSMAKSGTSQHRGLGKRLLATAEALAKKERCVSIYVISGVGVRNYYRRVGYQLNNEKDGAYMVKHLRYTFSETCVDMFRSLYGRERLRTYEECVPYVVVAVWFFMIVVSSCVMYVTSIRVQD